MDSTDLADVRRTLWAAADQLRANSSLGPAEYRGPVLGLIFLAYAEHRFEQVRPELEMKATARRPVTPDDYRARSVLFVSEESRLSYLVDLPESEDLGAAVDTAMRLIETHNIELKDVLPKGYQRMEKSTLVELLRLFAPLPRKLAGDAFGLIYEDFLSTSRPRHLSNALGQAAVMRTRARIDACDGHEICRVDVARSSHPVWASTSKNAGVFFVRMNNSTRELEDSEYPAYAADRWPDI